MCVALCVIIASDRAGVCSSLFVFFPPSLSSFLFLSIFEEDSMKEDERDRVGARALNAGANKGVQSITFLIDSASCRVTARRAWGPAEIPERNNDHPKPLLPVSFHLNAIQRYTE